MNSLLRILVSVCLVLGRQLVASPVEYAIDAAASFVTVGGTFQGVPFSEQTPGSSVAHYGGTLQGELEGGLLALLANDTVSLFQPLPQSPIPASDNGGLGAYGFRINSLVSGEVNLAITGISLYLSTNYGLPLDVTDGFFAPADLGFFLRGDTLLLSGESVPLTYVDLHGTGAPNTAGQAGTLTNDGSIETLVIPIATTFSRTALSDDDLSLTFHGQIVATRAIPEPTTAILLVSGLVGCRAFHRRRHG